MTVGPSTHASTPLRQLHLLQTSIEALLFGESAILTFVQLLLQIINKLPRTVRVRYSPDLSGTYAFGTVNSSMIPILTT